MNKPDSQRVKDYIMEAPIGQYIGEKGAEILAERATFEREVANSEFLFREGETENNFYLVAYGHLALVKEEKNNRKPQTLHVMDKGDLMAELSFVDGTPHNVSAMALGDAKTKVIGFKADDIKPLITEEPQIMFDFMRAVIKRAHNTVGAIEMQKMALSDYISTGGKGRF